MKITEVLHLLCCPDCEGNLLLIGNGNGCLCVACETVFPNIEGIPILLDSTSRKSALEIPLLRKLLPKLEKESERRACENTIEALSDSEVPISYAWEDEVHWSKEYGERLEEGEKKNWNDRIWQREPLFCPVIEFLRSEPLETGKVILDLGCGEGQDFRHFLAPEVRQEDTYIGLDISLEGLLLNRARNSHKRALFIIGSADKPPLRSGIADVIISLGTLHHMEAKERGLVILQRLSQNGFILLSDPVHGKVSVDFNKFPLSWLRLVRGRVRSAHDDSLDEEKLRVMIEKSDLQIVYERGISGIIYYLLFRLLRPLILSSRSLHSLAHRLDEIACFFLGGWSPIFRPAGLLLLLKVKSSDVYPV